MKRKFTFLLMALLALTGFRSWGQTTILSENFEHGGDFPEGWTATHNTNGGIGWTCTAGNYNIGGVHGGTYAVFCQGSSDKLTDYLTTTAIDFSDYSFASLSFYYINKEWSGDKNEIRVEYSASDDGSWTILWSNTAGTGTLSGSWTAANDIDLSALCGGTYYLRFVDVDKWGFGVAIDDIVITGISGTSYSISYDNANIQHGSISGPATAFAGQTVTLTATPDTDYALDHFTVDGEPIVGNTFTMPDSDVTVSATFRRLYTLTVNDGTDVYSRAPFYGGGAYSYYTKSQFVIPASYMEDMQGGKISQLKFYLNASSYYYPEYSNDTWDVYVKELDDPSGAWWDFYDFGTMTKVYSGSISMVNNELTITFDEPFQYNDKSLMIGFNQTQTGFNGMTYWLGSNNTTGSAGTNRCRAGWQSGSQYETKPFLPKTTFTYTLGATYTVTVNQPATGGGIDANPKTDVTSGTTVTLSATPETGYDLSEWIVTNVTTSQPITVTNNQFTMPDSDVTVSATFAQLTQHNVNISQSIENGTVTASPSACYKGETVTLTFEPASGYANPNYNDIIVTDASSGSVDVQYDYITGNYYFIMPNSDVTVFATFNRLYNISLGSYEHGEVSTYPADNAVYEASVNISVKPDAGYQISSITVDYEGGQITPDYWGLFGGYHTYNFTMPAYNVTVNVSITEIPHYNVSIGDIANGTVAIVGGTSYMAGETVSLNVQPAAGYELESITATPETGDPITPSFDGNYYTFTMPASNVTVTATFISALTVYNGTTTNIYAPVYTYYGDTETSAAQFVVPASQIPEAMENGTITTMKFYVSNCDNLTNLVKPTYACYITEVENTTMSNFIDFTSPSVKVFEGHVSLSNGNTEMVISFSTPYTYNGGNLAIAFLCTSNGGGANYCYTYFYGTGVTNGSIYRDRSSAPTRTNNFIPKTTFYYTPGATRYNIICDNAITGGTISADPVKAAAGTVVTLSATPAYGYEFGAWVENYDDVTIVDNQFTMPEHDVTISATFNALPTYDIISAVVIGGTVHAEYDNVTITEAPEGTVITLVAEAAEDYIFEYFTVDGVQIPGTTYTMGTSAIEIGASFRAVQSYTIHYYVNGYNNKNDTKKETQTINITSPYNGLVPAGTEFFGWSFDDIATYQTEEPSIIGEGVHPTQECNVYAVFKFEEQVPATSKDGETWKKLDAASDLKDGDEIVFVYEFDDTHNYVMTKRHGQYNGYFDSQLVDISNNEIVSLPSNATTFTAKEYSGNWKFQYEDEYTYGETTLGDYYWNNQHNLAPMNLWEGIDTWDVVFYYYGFVAQNTEYTYNYVGGELVNNSFTYKATDLNPAPIYKKQPSTITNTYYMTSVLTDGEVAENTTAKNIVITTGTVTVDNDIVLTMNENGLFRNEDAANFVFGYGAQLITDNAGVLATMKKHINGTDWYTISSPLAASVNVTDVTNLIPNSVTNTNYDLYRFDEKNGVWENARPETGANPAFTTIDKGRGYIYANNAGADHIAFAGEINVADVECNLTNGAAHGFNLIGNPFSQNITLANVTGTAELADGFYVLNNDETWGPKLTGIDIKPLQGFLVQATKAGTATIEKPAASSKGERSKEQSTNIEMIVSNSIYRDNAFAMFGEGIGLNKINHRNAAAPMLYIPQDGEDFAIAFMDENTTVFPVSFKAMTTGSYSIRLKATDDVSTLVLVDNMTGEETNMLLEDSYTFIGSPADNENRFTVKLAISHNDGQADNEHFVYQNGSELVVNGEGTLQIFDVLGRVVISEEVHGQTVNVGGLNTGAYIVRLTGESVKTQKIVVR